MDESLQHVLVVLLKVQHPSVILSALNAEGITELSQLLFPGIDHVGDPLSVTHPRTQIRLLFPGISAMLLEHYSTMPEIMRTGTKVNSLLSQSGLLWTCRELIELSRKVADGTYTPPPPTGRGSSPRASTPSSQTADQLFKKGIQHVILLCFPCSKHRRISSCGSNHLSQRSMPRIFPISLTPTYAPTTPEEKRLFALQQTFVFDVLATTLLTDKGKSLVRKHRANRDAHTLYQELLKHAQESTAANIEIEKLTSWIATNKLDSRWRGTTSGYITYWCEQMRTLESLIEDPQDLPSDQSKKRQLMAALAGVPELRSIQTTDEARVANNPGAKAMDFEAYVALLETATVRYDDQTAQVSRNAAARGRGGCQANMHAWTPDPDAYNPYALHINAHWLATLMMEMPSLRMMHQTLPLG